MSKINQIEVKKRLKNVKNNIKDISLNTEKQQDNTLTSEDNVNEEIIKNDKSCWCIRLCKKLKKMIFG